MGSEAEMIGLFLAMGFRERPCEDEISVSGLEYRHDSGVCAYESSPGNWVFDAPEEEDVEMRLKDVPAGDTPLETFSRVLDMVVGGSYASGG
jgi:hypothetical protein